MNKRMTPLVTLHLLLCVLAHQSVLGAEPQRPAVDYATVLLLRFDKLPAADESMLEVDTTTHDIRLGPGRFGHAYNCTTGGNMLVRLPSEALLTDEMTLECWVRWEKPSDERLQRIVGRSSMYGFYLSGRKPTLTFFVCVKPKSWKSAKAELPLNEWTHLAGTFDGQKIWLYLNGKLVDEVENAGEIVGSNAPFYCGTEAAGDRYRFQGLIDEVRLSKIARTELMTGKPAERPKPTTELVPVTASELSFERSLVAARLTAPLQLDGKLNDAIWQSIPAAPFVTTQDASKPATPTLVRTAYDDTCLYIAYECFEKGQETQLVGTTDRDSTAIFKADGIETFLQPQGKGRPYFQIVTNTAGGLWDDKWIGRRTREKWDGKGIRTSGDMAFDVWTVELAIPFADLGVVPPKPGDAWRVNFCRQELPSRELTAFSFTGGGFGIPSRFGVLKFGLKPEASGSASGSHELRGTVLDGDGTPVRGAPVRTMAGLARTGAFGDFKLKSLPAGEVAIEIATPRYERFVAKANMKRPVEVAAPARLKRVDPYRPAYDRSLGFMWLKSSITEPPDMAQAPTEADRATSLKLLATPGEYESRAVAFIAGSAAVEPRAAIDALRGPAGAIPAANIDVRWTQRLLKRVQYKRAREDAVFNWRFLWRESPKMVKAGQVRQLVATVKVPEDAKPGTYRGMLTLASDRALPVELEVAGFRLAQPKKRVGAYYRGHLPDDQIDIELRDIHEHGGQVLVWHSSLGYRKAEDGSIEYDTDEVRRAVMLQKKHQIGPPFLIGTRPRTAARLAGLRVRMEPAFADEVLASAEFRRIYAGGIEALAKLEKELDAGEFVYTWMDEVMGRGRFEAYVAFAKVTRELTRNRIYITYHIRNWERAQELDPWVDVRGYHGHTLDSWLGEDHTWEELKAGIEKSGDEAWNYYNIREICVTSEWVRLCNGYWLWRSPLMAHTPWIYYAYGGSPFDDLDADRHDFAYAAPHPTKPEMVSTLESECFREGYDDLRYVVTLQQALAGAENARPKDPAVRGARALIKRFWDADSRVPVQAENLTAGDYLRRRDEMAEAILSLHRPMR